TLEKISEEVPHAIVREGGLSAILSFLDFFSFHVQRTAVTAAANCCRSLSPDSFDLVKEVTPIFKNILGYPDQRVVEQAALAVVRITDSYRHYPEKLESILSEDLLASVKLLLNPDSTSVGTGTYTQCLKMLSTAARASPNVAMQLVELGVAETANQILTGVGSPDWTEGEFNVQKKGGEEAIVMQNLVQRPKEQIQEALNLVCELLPGLPRDGIFDAKAFSPKERKLHSSTSTPAPVIKREELTPDLSAPAPAPAPSSSATKPEVPFPEPEVKMEVADDAAIAPTPVSAPASTSSRTRSRDHRDAVNEKRLELYSGGDDKRKLVVKRFYALLLPTLVDVYSASVNSGVRTKAVLGLLKITQLCDEESLASILKSVSMASFLAAILSSRDQSGLVTNALQLVELLLIKMPDAYQYFFRREGVMHEIERIAASPLVYVSKSKRLAASTVTSTAAPSDASAGAPADAVTVPPPTTLSSSEAQAQDMITLRARYLRDRYGAADSEPALEAKSALDNIRVLVKQLEGVEVEGLVEKMAALFADEKTPLSSFEMLESGLVDGLLRFATETRDDGPSVSQRQELLAKAFMPQLDGAATTPAFAVLVKRLQESLSRMEEFEVTLAASSSSDVDPRRSAPSMLARQLKLRLIAEEGSDVPRSCTNIVVSIHAIATFQAFNDYLRPRILAATSSSDRASGSRSAVGAGTLSSFLAAFAAANGVSPPPESGEQSTSATKASLTLEDAVASTSTAGPSNPPLTRRRSSRLSGKGADGASSSKATLDDEEADHAEENPSNPDEDQPMPAEDDEVFAGEDHDDEDEGDIEEDDELFATDFDAAPQSRDERTVHLEVNDDKLVAKTPDGTRVGTPTLGKSASTSKLAPPAPKPRASSYAAAVKSEPTDFHLEFSIGGKPVALDTTVYGAVHKHDAAQPDRRGSLWHQVYTVNFRKVAGPARPDSERSSPLPQSRDDSMPTILPSSIPSDSQQAKILQLLWVLHSINSEYGDTPESQTGPAPGLPESAFTNNKLTAKLNRQLEEPMIVASACLPDWATDLPQYFPFLFPFDTRHIFLQSTAFGYARLMQKWVGQARIDSSRRDDNLGFLGRLQRQKVRISRDRMLESAFKVFELYGSSRASLEVEFFGEVGSGLGPTLEFYALVSKEFARKDLSLWRDTDAAGPSSYVFSPAGLFPRPLDDATAEAGKKVLKVFRVLGQFVAKALMDSRIIDVHFSKAFMKMVLEYELPLKASTVMNVDKELGRSLSHLREYLVSKAAIEDDDSISGGSKKDAIDRIEIKGATVSDLTLDFTLPGYDIELKAGGRDIAVDMWNLEEYISLVIDWTLRKGVMLQVKEFKSGFSSVFPVRDLQSFTASELVMMTGALDEDWSVEGLTNAAKADHGFTMDSRPVRDLLSIMSELTIAERREFLSFITGSPRLPIGGFPALSPSLTVVRKDGGDGSLPSVMTCVNYIKLPDYSSREIVKERVMTAVKEGAGGFHLS
ncbi:E3 ubiquitin-protein ligase TRIP12, partial [Pseudohyphozyma bogoriensis]